MNRVSVDNGKVILTFNKDLYPDKLIQQTISDFKEVCEAKFEEDRLILKPKEKTDLENLGYEFYNYLLGLIKS